jgi:hypothetical protein
MKPQKERIVTKKTKRQEQEIREGCEFLNFTLASFGFRSSAFEDWFQHYTHWTSFVERHGYTRFFTGALFLI